MESNLSPEARDAIKEILNIGAAHAATALSKMVSSHVNITVPELKYDAMENIPSFFGHTENIESLVVTQCSGDAPGVLVLSLPEQSHNVLTDHLNSENGPEKIAEVGNILAGSYLSVLEKFLDIEIRHNVTANATDMIGALISSVLIEFGEQTDNILAGLVGIDIPELKVEGRLFLLFTPDSTQTIIAAANAKVQ